MGHLTLTGIGKDYDGVEVSRDIDLSIEDGELGLTRFGPITREFDRAYCVVHTI